MTVVEARVIADSIGEASPRLHTQRWTHPTFNHQETLRHRRVYVHDNLALAWEPDFSLSVSSSRAIPFERLVDEAADPERRARPVRWGRAQRGMNPGGDLDDVEERIYWPDVAGRLGLSPSDVDELWVTERRCAERIWDVAAGLAARAARVMGTVLPVHKTYPNRMIAPYVHTHCLATATEPGWLNFFGLRLDAAADPTLRALAEAAWRAWNEGEPRRLEPGRWHLPYADDARTIEEVRERIEGEMTAIEAEGTGFVPSDRLTAKQKLIRISVARCARLSYASFETGRRSTIEEDLALHDRLLGSLPIHASPAEHQATPDGLNGLTWDRPELGGNLGPGWVQYRKTIPGEAIAPLPEAYR